MTSGSRILRYLQRPPGIETWWHWLGIFLAGLVFYLLSSGPAVRCVEEGWLPRDFVGAVYRPLALVRGTPVERLLNGYIRLWLPPPYQGDLPN
ncbi:MAG: hypothetical protein EXS31_04795 [Pedosphaera sp.]|nr:hypothetical protein [Pedosphaera sp.]